MIAQVVEVPSATAIEKPLEANLAKAPMETKVLPTVLPKVGLQEVKPPLVVGSPNQPTDAIAFWLGEAGWAFELNLRHFRIHDSKPERRNKT